MLLVAAGTGAYALPDGEGVRVRGPGLDVQLTGGFAEDFLRAFAAPRAADAPRDIGRLATLEALGRPAHRALAALARAGGARPWEPLGSVDGGALLFLEVTGRCNERCQHCYAGSGPEVEQALERELCLQVIRDARALGYDELQLTGGDPLLCPFLPELAAEGRAQGYARVEVYTNGLALTPERLEALAAHGVEFALSVYSHDPAVHDGVTGVPGSHARTLSAVRRIRARGLQVRVGVTAVQPGADHLAATLAQLEALGVPRASITADQVRDVGRGSELPRTPLPDAATPPDAAAPGPVGGHTGHARGAMRVRWPGKLAVAYTGQVHPCIFARGVPLGDVRRERLADIVGRARTARAASVAADPAALVERLACLDCRLSAVLLGGLS